MDYLISIPEYTVIFPFYNTHHPSPKGANKSAEKASDFIILRLQAWRTTNGRFLPT